MKKSTSLLFLFAALCFAAHSQIVVTTVDSVRLNDANGVPVDSGTVVQVTGVVYGPNSYPTHNGLVFMLKGANLGIEVYSKDNYGFTYGSNLHDGDSVIVIGTSSTYHGQAEIELTYTSSIDTIIKFGTTGAVDTPLVVSTIGESDESVLIQVNNINMNAQTGWTVPHAKHDFNVNINGFYLYIDSFMSPDLWNLSAAPAGTYNIVGYGTQYASGYPYNTGYSLYPRSLADFHQVTTGIHSIVSSCIPKSGIY